MWDTVHALQKPRKDYKQLIRNCSKESHRMQKINARRPAKTGKVRLRAQPVTLYRSQQQTVQNRLFAILIKSYVVTNLGQCKDGKGGKE